MGIEPMSLVCKAGALLIELFPESLGFIFQRPMWYNVEDEKHSSALLDGYRQVEGDHGDGDQGLEVGT